MQNATAHNFIDQNVDRESLENQVKDMYQRVAENPDGEFHFEMGRALCERLGYKPADLDKIPADAIKSFAGVGYYFHLAKLKQGESVIDLGSGSGTDTFIASLHVGDTGSVTGIDMTDAQRAKAAALRDEAGFTNIDYVKSYIEDLPAADASYVAPFDFLRLPMSAILGYVLFQEVSDPWVWAGAAVIFWAAYYNTWMEKRAGGTPMR